jgi:2-polyprenyl-3-methyl-5-hydroxy-6-metoxy-1,4-benzoquinol methylase
MKLETERDCVESLNAAKALAVASAWNALGLFDKLLAGPVLREALPGDRRALEATIPVLVHVGLLAADERQVTLTPTARRLHAENALPTVKNLELLADLGSMAQVISRGGPVRDAEGRSKVTRGGTVPDPVQTEQFMNFLYRISEEPALSTLQWLGPHLPKRGAVLDLGGGHGRYARAFADAGHTATLFDQPMVVDIARKRHGDALTYLAGDFHQAESLGGPYDLVIMCNVVHGEKAEANASLIARAAKALRPGGRLAIRDMFLDDHGAHPSNAVFFGITMLYYTEHGLSPSVQTARAWCEAAGLADVHLVVTETHQILSAVRP